MRCSRLPLLHTWSLLSLTSEPQQKTVSSLLAFFKVWTSRYVLSDFKSWLETDFVLKQSGTLKCALFRFRCGLCNSFNHHSFFRGDHSLSNYTITTTLLSQYNNIYERKAWAKVLHYKANCTPVTLVYK